MYFREVKEPSGDSSNFRSIEQLHMIGFASIPNEKGIYFAIVPDDFEVIFTEYTEAIPEYMGRI